MENLLNTQYIPPNRRVISEGICLDDVLKYDKDRFNSNNHWIGGVPPEDYGEVINVGNTHRWVDLFHRSSNYQTFTIDNPSDLVWIKQASELGSQTGRFSSLYREELDDFVHQHSGKDDSIGKIFNKNPDTGESPMYFIRTENVSLKYGQHGAGPYRCLREVMESLTTCIHGHRPVLPHTESIKVYVLPWLPTLKLSHEYRVFVHQRQITAISQQGCYSVCPHLQTEEERSRVAKFILDYFDEVIREKIDFRESYTYDFALLNGNDPYFIEINCFGKEYAAGSSLFHWLLDEDKLYGRTSSSSIAEESVDEERVVYFRYCIA